MTTIYDNATAQCFCRASRDVYSDAVPQITCQVLQHIPETTAEKEFGEGRQREWTFPYISRYFVGDTRPATHGHGDCPPISPTLSPTFTNGDCRSLFRAFNIAHIKPHIERLSPSGTLHHNLAHCQDSCSSLNTRLPA